MTSAKWNSPPDFDEVRYTFIELARIKAELKLLDIDIEVEGLEIKKANPRKSYLLVMHSEPLYRKRARLEAEKETLEGLAKFFDYHKEMFKTYGYVNR